VFIRLQSGSVLSQLWFYEMPGVNIILYRYHQICRLFLKGHISTDYKIIIIRFIYL